MKIYTKTGDQGETSLFGGQRVRKDDLRIDTLGMLDELNSSLGLALAQLRNEQADSESHPKLRTMLQEIQALLLSIGAKIASPGKEREIQELTSAWEAAIDTFEAEMPVLKQFVLPGGSCAAAQLHHARSVCRRAERSLVALGEGGVVLVSINRLSDLLFVLARYVNHLGGQGDTLWEP